MDEFNLRHARTALEIAENVRDRGNLPFRVLLVDEHGHEVIAAENTVVTDGDCNRDTSGGG